MLDVRMPAKDKLKQRVQKELSDFTYPMIIMNGNKFIE